MDNDCTIMHHSPTRDCFRHCRSRRVPPSVLALSPIILLTATRRESSRIIHHHRDFRRWKLESDRRKPRANGSSETQSKRCSPLRFPSWTQIESSSCALQFIRLTYPQTCSFSCHLTQTAVHHGCACQRVERVPTDAADSDKVSSFVSPTSDQPRPR